MPLCGTGRIVITPEHFLSPLWSLVSNFFGWQVSYIFVFEVFGCKVMRLASAFLINRLNILLDLIGALIMTSLIYIYTQMFYLKRSDYSELFWRIAQINWEHMDVIIGEDWSSPCRNMIALIFQEPEGWKSLINHSSLCSIIFIEKAP
jgi:hypothetical protein